MWDEATNGLSGGDAPEQRVLNADRISEFYHDNFVADQARDFGQLVVEKQRPDGVVADVGGGCGYFAAAISRDYGVRTRVLDTDPASIAASRDAGVEAKLFDALAPKFEGDEEIASFNLILHHLIGTSDARTRTLQMRAVETWKEKCRGVFVNEYIYESPVVAGFSARLIWWVTSSRFLSAIGVVVSRFIPSLRANTFGVGVRFRTAADWRGLFQAAGFKVVDYRRGDDEPCSFFRRLMGIRSIRRDSFFLAPVTSQIQS
jgi:hypothetical protein